MLACSCSTFDHHALLCFLSLHLSDFSVCLYCKRRLWGGWRDNSLWYFSLSSSLSLWAVCTVINWAGGVSMALSYFGLQLGSLTLAASLAWILSSQFWSQVWFNLENVSLASTSLFKPQEMSCSVSCGEENSDRKRQLHAANQCLLASTSFCCSLLHSASLVLSRWTLKLIK